MLFICGFSLKHLFARNGCPYADFKRSLATYRTKKSTYKLAKAEESSVLKF